MLNLVVGRRCLRRVSQHINQVQQQNKSIRLLRTSCIRCNKLDEDKLSVKTGKSSSDHSVSVFEQLRKEEPKALTVGAKVVENTKTGFNLMVIIAGCGVVFYLGYSVLSEMFSSVSPTAIFKMSMKKIQNDERAVMIVGDKIKGFGDPHSRTRKRLEHQPYEVAGTDYLRVVFHIEGNKRNGVVHADLKKSAKGWKVRYIIIDLEGFPPGRLTIEDNRHETDAEDLPDIDYSEIDKEFK